VDLQVSLSALAPTEAAEKALAVIPSDREAFVEVAGDVAVRGSWTVGLAHPRKPRGQAMAAVQLRDAMLSVVSDQEGSFDRDGTRYHPTLDPDSGQPGRGAICAAVVHPDGAMAAGLARALMVVGPDDKLVRRLGGWAMVVDPRGAVHQLGSAPGMVPRVELLSAVVP
jgi:thiamine biosynthesis lipoprotein ApbE